MTENNSQDNEDTQKEVVEDFLASFSQKCVEFGYYCDQYMREEINLGEITRRMSEATGEGEGFFGQNHAMMSPEQVYRYSVMQDTLDQMTTNLIETEIKRNREIIQEALRKGEYFIVNITFNSIHSSIYMVYSSSSNQHQMAERDLKLAALQQEQELAQALMKVLKVIDQKIMPPAFDEIEYRKLAKAFQIYIEYFKRVETSPIKEACDNRVQAQYESLADYLQAKAYFGDRFKAYEQMCIYCETLRTGFSPERMREIEAIRDRIRPPNPTDQLDKLYREVLEAEGEANVYAAVVQFQNFCEAHPNEPKIGTYRREIRRILVSKGYT